MSSLAIIPEEVVSIAIGYLTIRHLASASLVSRSWRKLVFPRLYHSVHLTLASHLERLKNMISSEHEHQSTPPVSAYLRELVFDEHHQERDMGLYIGEDNLLCLAEILPRLHRLEHFSWDMHFIPRNVRVLRVLQSECPSLNSLHFTIKEDQRSLSFYSGEPYLGTSSHMSH